MRFPAYYCLGELCLISFSINYRTAEIPLKISFVPQLFLKMTDGARQVSFRNSFEDYRSAVFSHDFEGNNSAVPTIDGDTNDPGTSVQPGQQFRRYRSILGVQEPSHQLQDLSRWHTHCQSFLLQTIQRQTERDVKILTLNSTDLMHHLVQQLKRRYNQDSDLSFLDLKECSNIRSQAGSQHTTSLGRSSTTSESSVGSMSSQVSDSFDNDVQESTTILLQSLQAVKNEVRPRSKVRRHLNSLGLRLGLRGSKREGEEGAKILLYTAISDVKRTLLEFRPEM